MAYDAKTQRLISLKKLAGKAQTSNDKDLANEALPSGVTMASSTIFSDAITSSPSDSALYTITGNVEYIRFPASFILGSNTTNGRHGFELKLPSDYESNSSNPKAGTAPFVNDQVINATAGELQIVPTSFSNSYEPKPFFGGTSAKGSGTQIPLLGPRNWYLDSFNGVLFQQDPPGTGDHAENPTFVEAYLYIGKMVDSQISAAAGRTKSVHFLTTDEAANTSISVSPSDFSNANYDEGKIDVFMNGQLLHSGSSTQVSAGERDYYVDSATSLRFAFDVKIDDILDVIVYTVV